MPCAERRNGDRFNLCIAKDEDNKPRSKHTMRRCDVVPVLAFPEYESVPKVTGKERGSHINRLTTAMELRQAERVKEPETQPRISNCTKCFDCTLYRREPCKKGLTHVYLTWEMP
jgi:hypothetical protein